MSLGPCICGSQHYPSIHLSINSNITTIYWQCSSMFSMILLSANERNNFALITKLQDSSFFCRRQCYIPWNTQELQQNLWVHGKRCKKHKENFHSGRTNKMKWSMLQLGLQFNILFHSKWAYGIALLQEECWQLIQMVERKECEGWTSLIKCSSQLDVILNSTRNRVKARALSDEKWTTWQTMWNSSTGPSTYITWRINKVAKNIHHTQMLSLGTWAGRESLLQWSIFHGPLWPRNET